MIEVTLEDRFEAAKLDTYSELYGWQMKLEDLTLPTYEVFELFLTGLPLSAGRMQWTGSKKGWALYAHIPAFREIEKFLNHFGNKFYWEMPPHDPHPF